jgi:hypothetical protein
LPDIIDDIVLAELFCTERPSKNSAPVPVRFQKHDGYIGNIRFKKIAFYSKNLAGRSPRRFTYHTRRMDSGRFQAFGNT